MLLHFVDLHQISAVENPAARFEDTTDSMDMMGESSKDRWYDELENNSEPPDTGEFEDRQSDISDYEETLVKKKKRKVWQRNRGYVSDPGRVRNL